MNPFPYTFDNKRYHTLAYHNRVQNCKTQKAVIDAGLSCPNIDGTCGVGGCIFCDGGSGYFTQDKAFSVTEQLQAEKVRIHKKSPESKIIAYFQTHTNTYAPVEKLRTLYEEALAFGVYGVSIATRPDCIGKDVLSLLKELTAKRTSPWNWACKAVMMRRLRVFTEDINTRYLERYFCACAKTIFAFACIS